MITQDRRRFAALIVLCTGMLMIVLDVTVVNVALAAIRDDLGFTDADLAWVVNAYMISFAGLLLLAGRLGDLIGRRRVFLLGLALFTAASLACGLAGNRATLVVARFVQGVGGALTSAVILGMIVTMFPQPREQARAIGAFAFVASAGGALGLLLGGALTQALNWHWIFFVNLPIGVVTAALTFRVVDRDEGTGVGTGLDVAGAVTITAALMTGVYAIVGPAATLGWGAPRTLWTGAVAVALLIVFVVRELTAANPLVPFRIFASRAVAGANLIQMVSAAGMFGAFFLGSLYLKGILGYSALQIGLASAPTAMLMGVLSLRFTEPLVTRFGARLVIVSGLVMMGVSLVMFARLPTDAQYLPDVLPMMLLMGVGAGLAFPALMTLAMAGVSGADAGLASGLVNTTAEVGSALGLAVLATLAAARTNALTTAGRTPTSAATLSGYHLAFWVAAAFAAAGVLVALAVLRSDVARGADEQVGGVEQGRRGAVGVLEHEASAQRGDPVVQAHQR